MRYVQVPNQRRKIKAKRSNSRKILGVVCAVILIFIVLILTTKTKHGETAVITPTSSNPSDQKDVLGDSELASNIDATLQAKLETWASKYSGEYAIVVQETGGKKRSASYNARESMVPASTYKVFVAYAVLLNVQNGELSLNNKTTTGATISGCLTKMIVNSDNTCARALGFLVDWKNINTLLQKRGLTNTDLNNYVADSEDPTGDKETTAQDLADFLVMLQEGSLLNKSNTNLLLDLMKRQVWHERINSGVPDGVVVANKPGWLGNVQADAGIIYAPSGTFVLVILSTGGSTSRLATLTSNIYEYLAGN